MHTKEVDCLTNFPNKHFSLKIVRWQLMWSLKNRLQQFQRWYMLTSPPRLYSTYVHLWCPSFSLFKPSQNSPPQRLFYFFPSFLTSESVLQTIYYMKAQYRTQIKVFFLYFKDLLWGGGLQLLQSERHWTKSFLKQWRMLMSLILRATCSF